MKVLPMSPEERERGFDAANEGEAFVAPLKPFRTRHRAKPSAQPDLGVARYNEERPHEALNMRVPADD
jgi:transposase InsO family protein